MMRRKTEIGDGEGGGDMEVEQEEAEEWGRLAIRGVQRVSLSPAFSFSQYGGIGFLFIVTCSIDIPMYAFSPSRMYNYNVPTRFSSGAAESSHLPEPYCLLYATTPRPHIESTQIGLPLSDVVLDVSLLRSRGIGQPVQSRQTT